MGDPHWRYVVRRDGRKRLYLSCGRQRLDEGDEINDPDSNNDWERGDINHGVFETADLGISRPERCVMTAQGLSRLDGGLRQDHKRRRRSGVAGGSQYGEIKGNQPYRLRFRMTDRGQ